MTRFDIVGMVELRDKAFSASTSATVCIFSRKRSQEAITLEEVKLRADVQAFIKKGKASEVIRAFESAAPDLYVRLKQGGLAEFDALLAFALNRDLTCEISYSGDKRDQEGYLGYRFSTARGKEGIQFVENSSEGGALLYSETDDNDLSTVSAHIRQNFLGISDPIPEVLKDHLKRSNLNELVDYESYRIANPSSLFIQHAEVSSNSPFGDFIDSCDASLVSLETLLAEGTIRQVKGLNYPKTMEVPYKTGTVVLTADSIDLKSGTLIPRKERYLSDAYKPDPAAHPIAGDVVITIASGSLAHLGKAAYISSDVSAFVGGFLSILRPKDKSFGKILFYNLLSERFRRFIAVLKDQNINNLPPHELKRFLIRVPIDIDAFTALAEEKESELASVNLMTANLRNGK